VLAIALARSATVIAKAVTDAGQGMTEAMGGFWSMSNEEPAFVPLDEFISNKVMDSLTRGEPVGELVLEDELDG
jgi:hypothetical protein